MRTILAKDSTGEFKFEIDDDAHITFGPDVPFEKGTSYDKKYSLRVYADGSKKKVLATFNNVAWFRDLTIKVARLVVREEGKTLWKSDEDGYEASQSIRYNRTWEDPQRPAIAARATVPRKTRKRR